MGAAVNIHENKIKKLSKAFRECFDLSDSVDLYSIDIHRLVSECKDDFAVETLMDEFRKIIERDIIWELVPNPVQSYSELEQLLKEHIRVIEEEKDE